MAKNVKKQNSTGAGSGGGLNEDDFRDMYGGRYLAPDDVKKPTETSINAVEKEIFDRSDGKSEAKLLLHFRAFRKPLPVATRPTHSTWRLPTGKTPLIGSASRCS